MDVRHLNRQTLEGPERNLQKMQSDLMTSKT